MKKKTEKREKFIQIICTCVTPEHSRPRMFIIYISEYTPFHLLTKDQQRRKKSTI